MKVVPNLSANTAMLGALAPGDPFRFSTDGAVYMRIQPGVVIMSGFAVTSVCLSNGVLGYAEDHVRVFPANVEAVEK